MDETPTETEVTSSADIEYVELAPDTLVTAEEAGKLMGVSGRTIRRRAAKGQGVERVGQHYFVHPTAIKPQNNCPAEKNFLTIVKEMAHLAIELLAAERK